MAIPLTVPEPYKKGFAKIRDLDDESSQALLAALGKIPRTTDEKRLSSAVADMVDTVAASDIEEIVPALLSLYSHLEYSQSEVSEVAAGIAQAMVQSDSEPFKMLPEDGEDFERRLGALLGVDLLRAVVRAGVLSFENERSLIDTRIITEIRPVFSPRDPEEDPEGAVILHTLKMSYRDDNRTKDFFVTFDASDIRKLLDQLGRAKSKADTLKRVLGNAEVDHIDTE